MNIFDKGKSDLGNLDFFDEMQLKKTSNTEEIGEMMSLFLKAMSEREAMIAPDTFGADKLLIEGFITPEMSYEFNVIGREFLKRNFDRLREYDDVTYYNNCKAVYSDPITSFQNRIMNTIYNAAKSGDEYSIELMKYLYKTYHKKEYKQLRKFSVLSNADLVSLIKDEEDHLDLLRAGRILGMCKLMGIRLDDSCAVSYMVLNKRSESFDDEQYVEFLEFPDGLFMECSNQVHQWIEEAEAGCKGKDYYTTYRRVNKKFNEIDRFADVALRRYGYPGDFLMRANREYEGQERLYAITLALLRYTFPKKEFDFDTVQQYALIVHAIEALTSACDEYDDNIGQLLGIDDDKYQIDDEELIFNADEIRVSSKPTASATRENKPPKALVNVAPVNSSNADEKDYLAEIAELRKKLADKDRDYRNLRIQYEQARTQLKEAGEYAESYKNDRDELIKLRNTMYEISQEEDGIEMPATVSVGQMKKIIEAMDIVIIGGNENWVKKLRQEFPKWRYISANASGAINSGQIQNAQMVYFFTDTLGHSNYYKFIQAVREHKVPYRYMHGVNIDGNIVQVYKDFEEHN